ncbi:MAG TPA: MaoC family dehydratase [Streptosporangiaceae bacterium]|nr:MaoC family dehydratase [Streptosporangiaceae bacterium]
MLTPGSELEPRSFPVTRLDLVKYAGVSGDFNVIHWNERIARSVGLPNVIAHGMFSMAQAGRYVTDLAGGDPGAVTEFSVRFSSPVVVPDDDNGAVIEISGTVAEQFDDGRVAIDIVARQDGTKVLSRTRAVIRVT